MSYAVAAPALHTLTVAGRAERFPVNRIFCVGRNYAAHAREMGKDPDRDLSRAAAHHPRRPLVVELQCAQHAAAALVGGLLVGFTTQRAQLARQSGDAAEGAVKGRCQ